jgi:hypothetical protein
MLQKFRQHSTNTIIAIDEKLATRFSSRPHDDDDGSGFGVAHSLVRSLSFSLLLAPSFEK